MCFFTIDKFYLLAMVINVDHIMKNVDNDWFILYSHLNTLLEVSIKDV